MPKSKDEKRKPSMCPRCLLHDIKNKKTKAHEKECRYRNCQNFLCSKFVTHKQQVMKIEQRIWRKFKKYIPEHKRKGKSVCDKCRNHCIYTIKKGHDAKCEYRHCQGPVCQFSNARQQTMSLFLRIQRGHILCEVFENNLRKYSKNVENTEELYSTPPRKNKHRLKSETPPELGNLHISKVKGQQKTNNEYQMKNTAVLNVQQNHYPADVRSIPYIRIDTEAIHPIPYAYSPPKLHHHVTYNCRNPVCLDERYTQTYNIYPAHHCRSQENSMKKIHDFVENERYFRIENISPKSPNHFQLYQRPEPYESFTVYHRPWL